MAADRGRRTHRLPAAPDLLSLFPPQGCAWVREGSGIVGAGELRREALGAEGLREASRLWRSWAPALGVGDDVRLPGTGAIAFVSASFVPGDGVLVVPEAVVGRHGDVGWVTGALDVSPREGSQSAASPGSVTITAGALTDEEWQERATEAVRRIRAGRLQKVVLARDVVARSEAPLDLPQVARRLAAAYPTTWTFLVDGLVGATPELLVRVQDWQVTSRVLAGTAWRTDASDPGARLQASGKDREEHAYAVASVVEVLRAWCADLRVPEPAVLELPNVVHLATTITGTLADPGSSVLDVAAALHPSAAVCGTPRAEAAAAIAELESMDRGRYGGPVGWVDAAGNGEIGIALRCGQQVDERTLRLYAGCGLVAGSDPVTELAETRAKLAPMLGALGVDS